MTKAKMRQPAYMSVLILVTAIAAVSAFFYFSYSQEVSYSNANLFGAAGGCTSDDQCPAQMSCIGGYCYCFFDSDCNAGQVCVDNKCTDKAQCSSGQTQSCVFDDGCAGTRGCRTDGTWGACQKNNPNCPGECKPASTANCNVGGCAGKKTCGQDYKWGSCTKTDSSCGSSSECTSGQTRSCFTSSQGSTCTGTQKCRNEIWDVCVPNTGTVCSASTNTCTLGEKKDCIVVGNAAEGGYYCNGKIECTNGANGPDYYYPPGCIKNPGTTCDHVTGFCPIQGTPPCYVWAENNQGYTTLCQGVQACDARGWLYCKGPYDCPTQSSCTDGQTQSCTTVDNCPGTRICSSGSWGQCVKTDQNCGSTQSNCKELYPGKNVNACGKVNVVFVGMGAPDINALIEHAKRSVDLNSEFGPGGTKALTELEVYKDNVQKFNFWYVDQIGPQNGGGKCTDSCKNTLESNCPNLPNRYVANLCYAECQSSAELNGESYTYAGWNNPYEYEAAVFNHEFQHSFAELRDEHVSGSNRDMPGPPNCAPDQSTAQQWWGDLVGQTKEGLTVGYYDGCSYTPENIRPTQDSLMRNVVAYKLGLVNERAIANKLNSVYCRAGENSIAVLNNVVVIYIDNELSVINVWAGQGEYNTVDSNHEYTAEVHVDGHVFSAGFDLADKVVSESFSSYSNTADYSIVPKGLITVAIPVYGAEVSEDGKSITLPEQTEPQPYKIVLKTKAGTVLKTVDSTLVK